MRKALGMTLDTSTETAIQNFWTLGEFLEMGEPIELEKLDKNLKIQPQSIEAEQAVLGSMLTSPEAVNKAQEILSAESFYVDAHKKIFEVMIQLFNNWII